jgi:hypothetical protein
MSGFGERMQRAARERIETFRRDASAAPAFAVRVRPLRQARALAANANGALGVPDAVAFVVEPKTGLRLPGEFCVRGQTSDCAPLAGMGVRVKRIAGVGVKVYACGLYVHPKQAKQSVGMRDGTSAAASPTSPGTRSFSTRCFTTRASRRPCV